jgi:hypothetical protein
MEDELSDLEKLVPNNPVSVHVSINGEAQLPIVGSDFVIFGLVGGCGECVSGFFTGLESGDHGVRGVEGIATAKLFSGDAIAISIGDFEASTNIGDASDFENAISWYSDSRGRSFEAGEKTIGWEFIVEPNDEQELRALSVPFDQIQAEIFWRPGEAHVSLRIMSISVLEDGSIDSNVWMERTMRKGNSVRIEIKRLV